MRGNGNNHWIEKRKHHWWCSDLVRSVKSSYLLVGGFYPPIVQKKHPNHTYNFKKALNSPPTPPHPNADMWFPQYPPPRTQSLEFTLLSANGRIWYSQGFQIMKPSIWSMITFEYKNRYFKVLPFQPLFLRRFRIFVIFIYLLFIWFDNSCTILIQKYQKMECNIICKINQIWLECQIGISGHDDTYASYGIHPPSEIWSNEK